MNDVIKGVLISVISMLIFWVIVIALVCLAVYIVINQFVMPVINIELNPFQLMAR